MFWGQIRRSLSLVLLLGGFVFFLLVGMGSVALQPATALISEWEETPGQMLYQSRQTLRDPEGNFWQAIVFKRDSSPDLTLRLVGFPGVVAIDQNQPLLLSTSLGQTFEVANASQDIFEDRPLESNIAQYDLQAVLPNLNPAIPLALEMPISTGDTLKFSIPPQVLQEWQTIADR